jgi:hypothetical protein
MTRYKYELTGAMLVIGVLVFIVLAVNHSMLAGVVAAFVSMAIYLAGARLSMLCYVALSRWAHRGGSDKQEFADRGVMAMLWPVALPIAFVMYGALGIVNRVMPDSPG